MIKILMALYSIIEYLDIFVKKKKEKGKKRKLYIFTLSVQKILYNKLQTKGIDINY